MEKSKLKFNIIDIVFLTMVTLIFVAQEHLLLHNVINGLILLFCALVVMDQKEKFKVYDVVIMFAGFVLMSFISYFYSVDKSATKSKMLTIIVFVLLLCAGINYFTKDNNLYKFIAMYRIATLISAVYLVFTENLFSGDRIGGDISNYNLLGTRFAFAITFSLFLVLRKPNAYNIIVTAVLFVFVVLIASRSSLLVAFVSILFVIIAYYRHTKKPIIIPVLIAVGIFAVVLILIFNVPVFYDTIGARLEDAVSLAQTGEGDHSAERRVQLIEYGMQQFRTKPFFGSGLMTFPTLCKLETGLAVYAHNNYVELLVDVGIVGTFIYYVVLVLIVIQSIRAIKSPDEGGAYGALSLALLAGMFTSDFFIVNFYSKTMILIYMFVSAVYIKNREKGII